MSVKFYFDVHVRRAVPVGLRIRGVDVLTAQEDAAGHLDDAALLNRATERRLCRMLTLDGGGAKGFYTLGVLKEVEALIGRPARPV